MSIESADRFLEAATQDTILRERLKAATSPEEFLRIAEGLGYSFTTQELKAVVKENSEAVTLRRKTGIWPWLREVSWV
ncbi:Nif11-like leader peptide family natural product precursor [Aerosakkonema funiforme]|uniref:Nif11-like leader peptide family natural product n=1 Tax=Aerosakkonema funiforme FACHB-1375 TaxID=2949571 RepID=A0A926VF49_9CYAN|nr:Nif11-like leader peptide family natural product precursor [Aerosakkonema funiforme]MBD2182460.1 Nif11-like leader peptide family natural product precursor [Aerosakkonema funiforme FACHB-1375]